jgi:hypothetical protein
MRGGEMRSVLEHEGVVAPLEPVRMMGHEDDSRATLAQQAGDAALDQPTAHLSVDSREYIVK